MFKKINLIILAEIILFLGLFISILLKPESLSINNGISYFGIIGRTIPTYILSLVGSSLIIAYFSFFNIKKFYLIKYLLIFIFIFVIGLVIFPYNINNFYSKMHELFGVLIFVSELVISFYIAIIFKKRWINSFLLFIELIAGILSAFYLNPSTGFLLQSQMLYQLAFGLILIINKNTLQQEVKKDP